MTPTLNVSNDECKELLKILSRINNPALQRVAQRLADDKKPLRYSPDKNGILAVLTKGFREKRNVKIRYYSLSSDETRYREVSIYKIGKGFIIAHCHLRGEERTFVTNRVSAALLTEKHYVIPKGYIPESKVW